MAKIYIDDYGSGSVILCEECFDTLTEDQKEGFMIMDSDDPTLAGIKSDGHLFCDGEALIDGSWVSCGREVC